MLEIPPKLGFRADKYHQNTETAHRYLPNIAKPNPGNKSFFIKNTALLLILGCFLT